MSGVCLGLFVNGICFKKCIYFIFEYNYNVFNDISTKEVKMIGVIITTMAFIAALVIYFLAQKNVEHNKG